MYASVPIYLLIAPRHLDSYITSIRLYQYQYNTILLYRSIHYVIPTSRCCALSCGLPGTMHSGNVRLRMLDICICNACIKRGCVGSSAMH
jgi:hypothetical protein